MDIKSLAHTRWDCKYHIVFMPKYRRKVIYGKTKSQIGKILRELCAYKGIEIIEATACIDHIHMCVSIPPKYAVSKVMGYLKGKSTIRLFQENAEVRANSRSKQFWARGYFVSTVGLNEETIKNYIKNQEEYEKINEGLN